MIQPLHTYMNKGTSILFISLNKILIQDYNLATKLLNSKLDPTRKGIFLVNAVADKETFAFCTGTIWDANDPRCKGEQRYRFIIPGSNDKKSLIAPIPKLEMGI